MSRNNVFAALFLTAIVPAAFAQSGPMTIQEWSNRQADIKRAEMESKLDEQRRKMGSSTPAQIAHTCDEELSMYAVYGVGSKLRADFGFRGATVTLSPGDHVDLGGWTVDELTPTRALMVKRSGKKIVSRCPVYLSSGLKAPSTAAGNSSAVDTAVQVPPIVPVSPGNPANTPAAYKAQSTHGVTR